MIMTEPNGLCRVFDIHLVAEICRCHEDHDLHTYVSPLQPFGGDSKQKLYLSFPHMPDLVPGHIVPSKVKQFKDLSSHFNASSSNL